MLDIKNFTDAILKDSEQEFTKVTNLKHLNKIRSLCHTVLDMQILTEEKEVLKLLVFYQAYATIIYGLWEPIEYYLKSDIQVEEDVADMRNVLMGPSARFLLYLPTIFAYCMILSSSTTKKLSNENKKLLDKIKE